MARFSRRQKVMTRVHSANIVAVVLSPRTAGTSAIAVLNTRTREYQALVERDLLDKEQSPKDKDVDILLDEDYLLTVKVSKKGIIKINKNNKIGKIIVNSLNMGERLRLITK